MIRTFKCKDNLRLEDAVKGRPVMNVTQVLQRLEEIRARLEKWGDKGSLITGRNVAIWARKELSTLITRLEAESEVLAEGPVSELVEKHVLESLLVDRFVRIVAVKEEE